MCVCVFFGCILDMCFVCCCYRYHREFFVRLYLYVKEREKDEGRGTFFCFVFLVRVRRVCRPLLLAFSPTACSRLHGGIAPYRLAVFVLRRIDWSYSYCAALIGQISRKLSARIAGHTAFFAVFSAFFLFLLL